MARMNLKAWRANCGYTQEELGEKIGVSKITVFNWENGKTKPRYEYLIELSNLFKCSIEDIAI